MIVEFRCPECDKPMAVCTGLEEVDGTVMFEESVVHCPECLTKIGLEADVCVITEIIKDYEELSVSYDADGSCNLSFEYDGHVYTTCGDTVSEARIEVNKYIKAMEVKL